jgi:hypothetical protein
VPSCRRALAQYPSLLVYLESRSLKLLDHPLGELAPGIVGVLPKEPPEQVPAARQGEADREHQLSAERAMIHGVLFWFCSADGVPTRERLSRRGGLGSGPVSFAFIRRCV